MKKTFYIFFLLVAYTFLCARPVDIDKARDLATAFFPDKDLVSCHAVSEQLYLSTFENGGFVLISGDDVFPPVLGYSRTAPVKQMHPAFESRCNAYSRQIGSLVLPSREKHTDWDTILRGKFQKTTAGAEVLPLLNSKWDQFPYYNDQFPYLSLPGYTDQKAYAGCVAVVMGQLMRYYNHPVRGIGRRSYYSYSTDSTLSAWFDTTFYDWANMPDSLSGSSDTHEIAEVSRLLYQSAVSVDMDLQPEGSSSTYEDMMYSLVSYFDYSPAMYIRNADSVSASEWRATLKTALDNGNPIPYRGQGDDGGHAYLLDGYRVETETYFHINWGWGGSYDGWFLLSALAPTDGYDFSERQAAILGIRKNTDDITRLAYSGFEYWLSGWIYDGFNFVLENGVYDMVHSGDLAYAFDSLDQWLITPRIRIPDNDNTELSVWGKMLSTGRQCKVLLSEGDTARSDFTVELGTIAPHNSDWAEYTFNLRNYKNRDVYIAFNYEETGGYIVVDDLVISMPKAETSVPQNIPEKYSLFDVYPNPFNPETTVRYDLTTSANVSISIYDLQGKKITTLLEGPENAGSHSVRWDASGLPSGIYFCNLTIDSKQRLTRKMLLVK